MRYISPRNHNQNQRYEVLMHFPGYQARVGLQINDIKPIKALPGAYTLGVSMFL